MLYNILRYIVIVTVRIFFNSIYTKNLEQLPKSGPLIIASNHPSTFLDPLVISVWIDRPIYFLTNGGAFSSPFKKWLYTKLFMIPIYRQQDSKEGVDSANQNEQAFDNCYDMLAQGKVIIIFPEGTSENERKLRKIKTGLARIALGAEAKYNFKLNVKIACVGINYTNPRKFQSKLFVNFSKPILATDYQEKYQNDSREAVREMTSLISEKLESLIVITSDEKADKLVRKIEILYSNRLQKNLNLNSDQTEQIFTIGQYISDAVKYYQEKNNQRVLDLDEKIENYFLLLKKEKIRDKTVLKIADKKQVIRKLLKYIPQLLIILPLYIYGLIHNYLPFILPGIVAKKSTPYAVFRGPINLVTGIFTFVSFYIIYCIIFFLLTKNILLTIIYFISLPISGYLTFYYWNYLLRVFESIRLFFIFEKGQNTYELRKMRDNIIEELEKIKEEYLNS